MEIIFLFILILAILSMFSSILLMNRRTTPLPISNKPVISPLYPNSYPFSNPNLYPPIYLPPQRRDNRGQDESGSKQTEVTKTEANYVSYRNLPDNIKKLVSESDYNSIPVEQRASIIGYIKLLTSDKDSMEFDLKDIVINLPNKNTPSSQTDTVNKTTPSTPTPSTPTPSTPKPTIPIISEVPAVAPEPVIPPTSTLQPTDINETIKKNRLIRAQKQRPVIAPEYRPDLSEQERYVKAHNFYREKHCSQPVTWNNELAQKAREWAKELIKRGGPPFVTAHPTSSEDKAKFGTYNNASTGQNVGEGPSELLSEFEYYIKDPEDVVTDWYEEVALPNYSGGTYSFGGKEIMFKPSLEERIANATSMMANEPLPTGCSKDINYKYKRQMDCNKWPLYGHFTQVVWDGTKEIGCAREYVPNKPGKHSVWVCNYSPGGNISSEGAHVRNVKDPKTCKN